MAPPPFGAVAARLGACFFGGLVPRKRKSLSKRIRFEVFKRDGFRCVYYGCDPQQGMLRVDHVVAVANGGSNDPANLVTACHDCNGGKSAVPLEQRRLPVGMAPEAMREHLEQLREHLAIQREISAAKNEAAQWVAAQWELAVGPMSEDMFRRIPGIIAVWPVERLLEAMTITGRKLGSVGRAYDSYIATQQDKYFHGILRRWRNGE